jgi:hypothetical protein
MRDQLALCKVAVIPPGSAVLMVRQNHRGVFDVVADDVLIQQHDTEQEAGAQCLRLQVRQYADHLPAPYPFDLVGV